MSRYFAYGYHLALKRPIAMVGSAIALSLLLFCPLGFTAWQAYQTLENITVKDIELQNQVGIIIHLDEVLTMSARMAVVTSDLKWEQRYRQFEPQLDQAIKRAIAIAPDIYESEGAKATDSANMRLVAIENRAFDLVRQGRPKEALGILFSSAYEADKRIYAEGIQRSTQAIQQRIQANIENFRYTLLLATTLAVVSLLTLTPIWLIVVKILKNYMRDRELANQLLEATVAQRTKELAEANAEVQELNKRLQTENSRLSTELDIARQLQQMILPNTSELENLADLDIACTMVSATEVGGDYYDVIRTGDRILISIGDVTGHGIESGVMAIMAQTAIQTLVQTQTTDPINLHCALNQVLYGNIQRMQSDKSMTLALLDYGSGKLSVSGQHESILVVRHNGELQEIDTMDLGFPLALEADITPFVAVSELVLHSGDVVLLYTDGITEAENPFKERYGIERLKQVLQLSYLSSASQILKAIMDDLMQFINQRAILDDCTLVVLKKE
jgi:serine phosphatase RsbU (regulator of sigma subunit)